MRIDLFGGLRITAAGRTIEVTGSMQRALLFRLAIDAGTAVSYRALAEDIWGRDAPENTRAALQSIVSRLRSQLPEGSIESTAGGYRLAAARSDVDVLTFADLVAEASAATEAAAAARRASEALALWAGEPWSPSDDFDWFARDLVADREVALRLGGTTAAPVRSNIPAPLTTLVGRERELTTIADQLAANRLVTILGTGGAGKTRLAIETARARPSAVLVQLAPVSPLEVLGGVLAATGREIRTADSSEATSNRERVLEALGGREVLLVLDNCEHVITAAAELAADLLSALPLLRILTTSREPLGVLGEAFVSVGALEVPGDRELESGADLLSFSAIALFAQRAASAKGRELDPGELPTVARICARLDGLPLALELAAARLRTMSVDEVLDGLENRFALLGGGLRSGLPRHQTLRAMIDWSWSLLSPDERTVLARFSVYPAGVDIPSAPALAARMGAAPDTFDALVDRSLVQRENGRFRALETIREYGIERLAEEGVLAEARADQVRYVASGSSTHDTMLRGPDVHDAIEWFDAEDDNIAGALRYSTAAGMAAEAVTLGMSCAWYWMIRDRQQDARDWITAIAPLAETLDTEEARLITLVFPILSAFNASETGEPDEAALLRDLSVLPEMRVTAQSPDLLQLVVPVITAFTSVSQEPGWMAHVQIPRGEDLGLAPWASAVLNVVRSAVAQNRGDIAELGEASELAVAQFEQIRDWWGLALSQQMRSEWLSSVGRLQEALETAEQATQNMRRITTSWDLAQQQGLAISLLIRMGRLDEAKARLAQLCDEAYASGNVRAIAQVSVSSTSAWVAMGDLAAAREHLQKYDEIVATMPRMPLQLTAWAEVGRALILLADGDLDGAERSLRIAVDAALITLDHPIIGSVALALGSLALARGNVAEAVRALDLATAITGAYEEGNPQVSAIERAARDAGLGRAGEKPTRPAALESLRRLVEPA